MILEKKVLLLIFILSSFVVVAQNDKSKNSVKLGGAVRYNMLSTNYESGAGKLNPQFTWDTWRLNVDGSISGIDLSFEYRFYPTNGSHFIHHGYFGYSFSDNVYMKLGVSQVPFGISKFASHSYWFQGGYYVGLEDDYDMGISFDISPSEKVDVALAYFRQAEPEGPKFGGDVTFGNAGPGRYSYDIVAGEGAVIGDDGKVKRLQASLRELNQFNARVNYHFSENVEAGASAQVGGIYNTKRDDAEIATAFALHSVANFQRLNIKAEVANYNYRAKADDGTDLNVIQMGAYGYEYPGGKNYSGGVATKANLYMIGVAYDFPVSWGPISNIQTYVDYTYTDKLEKSFFDTQQLVPGMLISAGPIFAYVDYILGKNHPWLTDSYGKGLGTGVENAEWNQRFNINIGYYF